MSAFQCASWLLGTVMSPTISAVPAMAPSQLGDGAFGVLGTMSAIGLPKRVTRNGRPVRRTRSSVARQVALNFEMGRVSIDYLYHGP